MLHIDHTAAAMQSEKIPQMVSAQQQLNEGPQRTVVGAPPQLPSGTRRAIEKVLEENLRKMGITSQSQQTNGPGNAAGLEKVLGSTARNSASSNAGKSSSYSPVSEFRICSQCWRGADLCNGSMATQRATCVCTCSGR